MPNFYRGNYTQLWLTLRSDEILGLLDSDYLEDYNGVDGQISVVLPNNTIMPVLMADVPAETPLIPHDTFTGALELADLPNGHYTVRARVRDTLGNYTIIGAVANPIGNERIISLEFDIVAGFGIIISFGTLKLVGGVGFKVSLPSASFSFSTQAVETSFAALPVLDVAPSHTTFNVPLITEFGF